ncbi:MAG: hypothetical protein SFY96_14205 [Planctomycetota bacterium]|nr:hypothetical protein [Planctomycetota bacterium]
MLSQNTHWKDSCYAPIESVTMSPLDLASVAVNAAGITDEFCIHRLADDGGEARLEWLTLHFDGWCGLVVQVAHAGELMERFRQTRGVKATWGGELPHLYDVWDAIAAGLWDHLGSKPIDAIVDGAFHEALSPTVA